jgi:hypothetical protein
MFLPSSHWQGRWITRNQGEGGEGQGRMWMKMTAIAEARLRRTATSYCTEDSLAEGQCPLREEGVFTLATATVFLLDIIVTACMDP